MKFYKTLTVHRSPLEGLEQYENSFALGELRRVKVYPSETGGIEGIWKKIKLEQFDWSTAFSERQVEVLAMRIRPRGLVIDELTRHRNTDQIFVPITAPILAIAGPSYALDQSLPDPDALLAVPVQPGEAINIHAGTWHTLPFALVGDLICMSVMYREDLNTFHDLRDLAACGWVGIPTWRDPEHIH
jgi:ureidoglycolate hydrolase